MIQFLYIDPGTGSMLFSILIGAAATLFFLAKAMFIKLKTFFTGHKDKDIVLDNSYKKYVIYNEDNRYWNLFQPICDEFEKRKIELSYLTSSKSDPCFEQNYTFVKPEFIGEGNKAFSKLNLLSAGVVLMTTPGLNVYQLKRSKNVKHYSHILHATNSATTYRLFGIDYFDSILITGEFQKADIRILEKQRNLPEKEIITVGCPYLDTLKKKISSIPEEKTHNFTVLVSPSWGKEAILSKYGEQLLDPLVQTGWKIIVRPHPQSKKSEAEMLEKLTKKYENCSNVEWDYKSDNIYSLKESDIMISDFSGIIFDYTFLFNKPVMYVNGNMDYRQYDAYDINEGKTLWEIQKLKEFGIELKQEQFSNIKEVIQNISSDSNLEQVRLNCKKEAWDYEDKAGEKVTDYLLSILKD